MSTPREHTQKLLDVTHDALRKAGVTVPTSNALLQDRLENLIAKWRNKAQHEYRMTGSQAFHECADEIEQMLEGL